MPDQPSVSKYDEEPVRSKTIPDDFIWVPEVQGWIPPGEGSDWDAEAWLREFEEEMKNRSDEELSKGLISVEQLRAAGALYDPKTRRKSLGGGKTLFDECDAQAPAPVEGDQTEAEGEPDEPAD